MEVVRLDKVTRKERAEIADLVVGMQEEFGFGSDPEYRFDLRKLQQVYIDSGGTIEVIKDRNRIVGCVAVKKLSDDVADIKRLRLLPEYRGKGLGRSPMEKALAFCIEAGFKKAVLDTDQKNEGGMTLFKQLGFVETKRGGNEVYFEKSLV